MGRCVWRLRCYGRLALIISVLPVASAKEGIERAQTLEERSSQSSASGDYFAAIEMARKAAEAYRKLGDGIGEARAINSMGAAQLYLGDYPAALKSFQHSLELARRYGDRQGEILRLNNVGNVFYFQGSYLEALRSYQAALERVKGTEGEPWGPRVRQVTIVNLATLFQRLGHEQRALDLYLQLRGSPQALSARDEARLLTNLGALYRRLGDPVKALEMYRAALKLYARQQHPDGQLGVLENIGIALAQDLHNLPGALDVFTRALQLAEHTFNQLAVTQVRLYRGEVFYRTGRLEEARQEFRTVGALAMRLDTTEEQWKALYGLGRVARQNGETQLALNYLRQAIELIESLRSRLELSSMKTGFLADKRDVYDACMELLLQSGADYQEIFDLLEKAQAHTFQERVRERGAAARNPAAGRLRELRAKMAQIWTRQLRNPESEEAAKLRSELSALEDEYLQLERRVQESVAPTDGVRKPTVASIQARLDPASAVLMFWVGRESAAVLWITRTSTGLRRIQFDPESVGRILSALQGVPEAGGDDGRKAAAALSASLLPDVKPLADPRIRHLIIVPDGLLQFLPFEILGTPGPLVERFSFSYVPSAALLSVARREGFSWGLPWKRELVAFGDPLVSQAADPGIPSEERWTALPQSAAEVHSIARMINGQAELYLGSAATRKRLFDAKLRDVPLLHFSTHASIDAEDPDRSRILLSPEHSQEGFDSLFCGEIPTLDLRGVDLVTVSACETERGKMVRGEGVRAFSRAFLEAGARATVTSLWRVADAPTAEFMKQFYYFLGKGKPKAEALRLAKLKFLRSGKALAHPYYWAAFVLYGDGLSPVPAPMSWSVFLAAPAALLLAAGWLALRRRGEGAGLHGCGSDRQ